MTPEQIHAQASVDAVKEEQALVTRIQTANAMHAEASAAYAQCSQVVLVLQEDMTMLDAERRQLILVRENPKRYGVSKWKANMQYRQCIREMRKIKADLKYALQAERRAAKHMDKIAHERVTVVRAQRANTKLQISLGLIPRLPRKQTVPALVELAQYTGLLDGSV